MFKLRIFFKSFKLYQGIIFQIIGTKESSHIFQFHNEAFQFLSFSVVFFLL